MVREPAEREDVRPPILDFPIPLTSADRALQEALEILRASTCQVHPLLDITLVAKPDGYVFTPAAGAGTAVPGRGLVDTSESTLNQVRLLVTFAAGNGTAVLYDVTNGVSLVSRSISAGNTVVSAWTAVAAKAGDRQLELRVIGDGATSHTVISAHAQFRTTSFQQ